MEKMIFNLRQRVFFYPVKGIVSLAALFIILSGNTVMAQLHFGDNMGNHTATAILNMSGKNIDDIGSLRHRNMNVSNLSSGGSIGTLPTATVDIYSVFSINQTTPNQTLSLLSPTVSTAGRMVYVVNVGTASFSIAGANVKPLKALQLIYNGSTWNVFNGDGGGVVSTLGTPVYSSNVAYVGIPYRGTMTVSYTGDNGATYAAGSAFPTPNSVTGLTATLRAGTLGSGDLVYDITGTPISSGLFSFGTLSFGGKSTVSGDFTIESLNCNPEVFTAGNATRATAYNGQLITHYNNGDVNGAYSAGTPVNSHTVKGLTAMLRAGEINNSGDLVYDISGVPLSGGTAKFPLGLGGSEISLPVISVSTLECDNAVFSTDNVAPGTAYSATMNIPYTGGSSVNYQGGSAISSTGVIGLSATLQSGTLASSGNLTYYVSGNAMTSGLATFPISFGGQTGSAVLAVMATPNPTLGSITLPTTDPNPGTAGYTGTATIHYTGGTGQIYPIGVDIASTGVSGLIAKLQAGTLGATGSLTYNISGTPAAGGTASFAIDFYGKTTSINVPVPAVTSFGAITFPGGQPLYNVPFNGSMNVHYTGGNGKAYNATTQTVNGLTASLASGSLAVGDGDLVYTIVGTPNTTGSISFAINLFSQTTTAILPVQTVASVNYAGATFSPNFALAGRPYTGTISIPYTGGTGATYTGGTQFTSTNIGGLTATLVSGTLNGSPLIYNVTGTVDANISLSLATFGITFDNKSGNSTLEVCNGAVKVGGVYTKNDGSYITGNTLVYLQSKYTATGDNLCVYKTSPATAYWSNAITNCSNGSAADGQAGIWRLPSLAEFVNINVVSGWDTMLSTYSSSQYQDISLAWYWTSSINASDGNVWSAAKNNAFGPAVQGPNGGLNLYRCVRVMSH